LGIPASRRRTLKQIGVSAARRTLLLLKAIKVAVGSQEDLVVNGHGAGERVIV
jgi:hypothetical protein